MTQQDGNGTMWSRRTFLEGAGRFGALGFLGAAGRAAAFELPFANGHRELASNFPGKGAMIVQRTRPPLLETPFEVFDQGVFTPNDRFYVRWHLANVPTLIDPAEFTLKVRGHVEKPLSLGLHELVREFEPVEMAAVNQCSGNSRGFFEPRVAGGEWGNGAMGNALWMGVRLKGSVMARRMTGEVASATVVPGTIQVPPDGQPIVLMADAQTLGGYPQAAHVISVDLPLVAQICPGDTVRFREVTLGEAHELLLAREHALGILREGLALKFS